MFYYPTTPPNEPVLLDHIPVGQAPTSTSETDVAGPVGFKAKRWRKNLSFIQARGGSRSLSRGEIGRGCSEVDPDLFDLDCSDDRLLAGVARLVFRHIAEGERDGGEGPESHAAHTNAIRTGKPTTADFNRDHFFVSVEDAERPSCLSRCCMALQRCGNRLPNPLHRRNRREEKTVDKIFELLDRVFFLLDCPIELGVLSAIYIENLIAAKSIRLTFDNWLSIVVASVLLASKVWEDVCPWNSDFARTLSEAIGLKTKGTTSLYLLESKFMKALDWQVGVSGETYASYYFAFRDADLPSTTRRAGYIPRCQSLSWSQTGTAVMTMVGLSSSGINTGIFHSGSIPDSLGGRTQSEASGSIEAEEAALDTSALTSHTAISREQLQAQIQAERARPLIDDVAQAPEGEGQTVIQERWALDPHNPYVGCLRHAQQAAPPSRHINDVLPGPVLRMSKAQSVGTNLDLMGTDANVNTLARSRNYSHGSLNTWSGTGIRDLHAGSSFPCPVTPRSIQSETKAETRRRWSTGATVAA